MATNGTIIIVSGSQTITGNFGIIKAIADSQIYVSGSTFGSATFFLPKGQEIVSWTTDDRQTANSSFISNGIEVIRVNNFYGQLFVQTVATA